MKLQVYSSQTYIRQGQREEIGVLTILAQLAVFVGFHGYGL